MASNFALKNKRNIVEEPVEKQEMWTFTDIECWVDKKVVFKWNTLFQEFQTKEFQVFLQYDPSTKLIKGIYKNIAKSGLHREAAKTRVLLCSDVIEWMTQRIDHESRTILNFEDKNVASYQAPVLNHLYHIK
jgi:Txe/YoeB family toxin of Txe-Axe toxin-antitoxin module